MASNLCSSLSRVEGFEVFDGDEAQQHSIESEAGRGELSAFRIGNIKFRAHQFKAKSLTISVIVTTFSFPAAKKLEKGKILSIINDFNMSKPGLKANLAKADGKGFAVNFSVDFIVPDELLVDEIVHPAVKLLRGSGRLLLDSFFESGFYENLRPKQ